MLEPFDSYFLAFDYDKIFLAGGYAAVGEFNIRVFGIESLKTFKKALSLLIKRRIKLIESQSCKSLLFSSLL